LELADDWELSLRKNSPRETAADPVFD